MPAFRAARVTRENRSGASLKPRVDRELQLAMRIHGSLQRRIVRIKSMTQKRHEVAVVAPQGRRLFPVSIDERNDRLVIVETSECRLLVAFHEGSVRGPPVSASRSVAEHVKCAPAERIASR